MPTTLTVSVGQTIAGTDITYLDYSEQGARFLVEGQPAPKRTGDSLRWSGEQAPGAQVELKLRLAHANATSARFVGTADITLSDILPGSGPANATAPIHYSGPVAYTIGRGKVVPGTTITYVGPAAEGAQLGGLAEYPYRRTGDSIVWEGRISNSASLRLEARVVEFDEHNLRVAGLVTIWLD